MVVGCHNRQSNYSKIGFITFPERRSVVEGRFPLFHVRSDGSAWKPGNGDRVYSELFINDKKSDVCTNPATCHQFRLTVLRVMQLCHILNVLIVTPN